MIETLNKNELILIKKLASHPVFKGIQSIEWAELINILLQRRFLSLSIINFYELAIDSLTDNDIKSTVREILYEEYPRNTKGEPLPSHRELLFHDLLNLGASRETILSSAETAHTRAIREESFRLLTRHLDTRNFQVGIITILRFWAEVLISVEYQCLWKKISERLSASKSDKNPRSEFYYFHMIHDARISDIGKEGLLGGLTHSQALALHLKKSIFSEEALEYCISLEKEVFQLKYQFYDQFI